MAADLDALRSTAMEEADRRYGAGSHGPRDAFACGVDTVIRLLHREAAATDRVVGAARLFVEADHPDPAGTDRASWDELEGAVQEMDGWGWEWSDEARCMVKVPRRG